MMSAKTMTTAVLAAALGAQPVAAAAAAQEQSCVPQEDAQVLGLALLPQLVGTLADKCAAVLPADAPLVARDSVRWGELDAARTAALPEATAAAERAVGALPAEMRQADGTPVPALLFVEKMAAGSVIEGFPTRNCAKVSQVFDALSPMPPANLVRLMTIMLTSDGGGTVVCRAGQQPNGPSIRPATRPYSTPLSTPAIGATAEDGDPTTRTVPRPPPPPPPPTPAS